MKTGVFFYQPVFTSCYFNAFILLLSGNFFKF